MFEKSSLKSVPNRTRVSVFVNTPFIPKDAYITISIDNDLLLVRH